MTPDPSRSKLLFGNVHRALADGESPVVIRIRLRDSRDRPVPNRQVELVADREGVTIEQPGVTDETGQALAYAYATTAGPVNVYGTVLPLEYA